MASRVQELNLPRANYEFAASTARPTLAVLFCLDIYYISNFSNCNKNNSLKKFMNLKSTLLLIGILFLMMLAGGSASAYIGYLMGREALKVVTQPDISSEQSLDKKKPLDGSHKGLKIIKEREILINVYNYIESKKKVVASQNNL